MSFWFTIYCFTKRIKFFFISRFFRFYFYSGDFWTLDGNLFFVEFIPVKLALEILLLTDSMPLLAGSLMTDTLPLLVVPSNFLDEISDVPVNSCLSGNSLINEVVMFSCFIRVKLRALWPVTDTFPFLTGTSRLLKDILVVDSSIRCGLKDVRIWGSLVCDCF